MKKVYVSDKTEMVLESLNNIDKNHILYDSFYEKEVEYNFHVNVYDNARVYDKARVYGKARVFGNAIVCGEARVYGNARVFGDAEVFGNAIVSGDATTTTKVINLIGLPYSITITDNHINIGCKQFTFETAKKSAKRNIDIEDVDYKEMIVYKDLLLELIKVRE